VWLPEAHALEGTSLLSGAQQVPVQRRLKSLSHSNLPPLRASGFLSPCERGWSVRMRAPSLPSTHGALAPSGAAIMAPSLGATNTIRASYVGAGRWAAAVTAAGMRCRRAAENPSQFHWAAGAIGKVTHSMPNTESGWFCGI
jgi:hypothetical protein